MTEQKPNLAQTGAALTTAGCSLMTMIPLAVMVIVLVWCALSIMFS